MASSYLHLLPTEIQYMIALYAPYQFLTGLSDMILPYFSSHEFLRMKAQIRHLSIELLEAIRENKMDMVMEMLDLDYKLNLLQPTERKQIIISLIENNHDQIVEDIISKIDPFSMDLSEVANTVGCMGKTNLMKLLGNIINQFGTSPTSHEIAAYTLIGVMESQDQSSPKPTDVNTIAEIFHISPIDLRSSFEKINEVPDEIIL